MSLSPETPDHRSGTDLAEYTSLLRRRWLIFVFCLAIGFTAGAAVLRLTPPAYTATAQVLVSPTGVQDQTNQVTGRQRESLNLDTEAQIAQSAVVATKAAATLHSSMPVTVDVTVPPNSAVLSVSATAATPKAAAAHARAYAQAYLQHRTEAAEHALNAQLKALSAKLKQVNSGLGAIAAELPALTKGSAERTIALQRQNVLSRQVYSLTVKYDALKTIAVTPGSLISDAVPPRSPSSPSLPLHLGSGLMLGLLAGAAAAFARDRLDTRLRTSADVERLTRLPVIAELGVDSTGALVEPGARRRGARAGVPRGSLHELASVLLAAHFGGHLLIRPVGTPRGLQELATVLSPAVAPTRILIGDDLHDLARADGALLAIFPPATSREVAAARRGLARNGTRVIGAVVLRPARRARGAARPVLEIPSRPFPANGVDTPLGRLVAPAGHRATGTTPIAGATTETTPLRPLQRSDRSAWDT
ncbi:Wzz/FepE/Etk N-terminal domain-containing protein [Streptosporangium soli]|nr:Wzz/FepE/Etk N-terminal domain-containing protein [Streptosporangium sp. KLBMP 9127]